MKHRDPALCLAYTHIAGREIHGIADVSIFQIIRQLFNSHHCTVILRLLCGCSQMRRQDHTIHIGCFGIGEVAYIAGHLTGCQRLCHIVIIYQCVSGKV